MLQRLRHRGPTGSGRGSSRPAQAAFSLTELLVVIAVISILATMVFPAIGLIQNSARKAACASMLRQWGYALGGYAADWEANVPPAKTDTSGWAWPCNMWYQVPVSDPGYPKSLGEINFDTLASYIDSSIRQQNGINNLLLTTSEPTRTFSRWTFAADKAVDIGYYYFGQSQIYLKAADAATMLTQQNMVANRILMTERVCQLSTLDTGLRFLNHRKDRLRTVPPETDGNTPVSQLDGANTMFGDCRVQWFSSAAYNTSIMGTKPSTSQLGMYYNGGAQWYHFPLPASW
jgi:prepilin-type N-terminal cleavage/methylation domain-containing protein